jgi:hypothetical protein
MMSNVYNPSRFSTKPQPHPVDIPICVRCEMPKSGMRAGDSYCFDCREALKRTPQTVP